MVRAGSSAACGSSWLGGSGRLEERRRVASGGRWLMWRSPTGSCGKRPRETSEPDTSAEGRHTRAAGVGGPVASGLPGVGPAGCWACPDPASATRARAPDDEVAALRAAIVRLATSFGRYGYRRVTALLRAEGWAVNQKRVERIWRRPEPASGRPLAGSGPGGARHTRQCLATKGGPARSRAGSCAPQPRRAV